MKQLLNVMMLIVVGVFFTQMCNTNITFAKSSNAESLRKIAIVIIADDPTFRTKSYFKQAIRDFTKDKRRNKFKFIPDYIRDTFEKNNNDFVIIAGTEVQNKYHNY